MARLLGHGRAGAKARAAELLDAFGLAEAAARQVKHYSGGMRRRLDIAASIVVTPRLMFLDEPTTGLDPRSRNQVWDIVRALVGQGTTVLLCTQYLEEADQLADRIAVIDHGRVIAEGTPAQLKASVGRGALHVRLLDPDERARAAELLGGEVQTLPDPAALSLPGAGAEEASAAIAALVGAGIGVAGFSLGQPSLDEVFLALTGHPAEDAGAGGRRMSATETTAAERSPELAQVHAALVSGERPPRPGAVAQCLTFGWRGHAQDQARPGAADRRHAHARAVPADVHLPVRRRGGGLDGRLPAVPAARHARAVGAVRLGLLGRGAQHGHDQGRRRPLPLAADLAPGAARRRRRRRQRPLRAGVGDRRRARVDHGLRRRGRRARRGRRGRADRGVRVRPLVGVHDDRPADARARTRS